MRHFLRRLIFSPITLILLPICILTDLLFDGYQVARDNAKGLLIYVWNSKDICSDLEPSTLGPGIIRILGLNYLILSRGLDPLYGTLGPH